MKVKNGVKNGRIDGIWDLMSECYELLTGKRTQLVPVEEYKAQRLNYWTERAARAEQARR